jgi:hypothetical protein
MPRSAASDAVKEICEAMTVCAAPRLRSKAAAKRTLREVDIAEASLTPDTGWLRRSMKLIYDEV